VMDKNHNVRRVKVFIWKNGEKDPHKISIPKGKKALKTKDREHLLAVLLSFGVYSKNELLTMAINVPLVQESRKLLGLD